MAHAARLNLRMQKEVKLLLTDPPPGASFPLLSVDSDTSSLSTIHAQIEGPEGTVYARGIFDIKVQIPERYPFQPPSVTFATPIYHPNIDNGGRICLDILNLPPKGAWQPSLNISTVLTSIGLLLTEPNPDDGLMCEASREYKYNRQAFDQKARLMTEKYAKGGIGGNGSSTQDIQTNLNPSMTESRESEKSRLEVSEFISSQKKPCGINQKLSLESSSSSQNRAGDGEVNEVHNDHLFFFDQMDVKGKRKGVNVIPDEFNPNHYKPHGSRRKLSLESSSEIQKRDGPDKENLVTNYSSLCDPQTASMAPSGSSMLQPNGSSEQKHICPQARESVIGSTNMSTKQLCRFGKKKLLESLDTFQLNDNERMLTSSQVLLSRSISSASHGTSSMILSELQPHKDFIDTDRVGKCSTDAECKKISLVAKKLSLVSKGTIPIQRTEDKENVAPVSPVDKLPLSSHQSSSLKRGIGRKLSLGPLAQLQGSNDNNSQSFVHPENLSTASSRTLPMQQHYGYKEKKQSNLEEDAAVGGKSKVQKIEDSPISEAVVVLDSEDSEDEKDGTLRSKLFARKRMGKWRAKA